MHANPPRTQCAQHGVKVIKLPWAEAGSRFTALFEALAIEWLKAASQKGVAQMLQLSWDEIHGILERAVQRGGRSGHRIADLVSVHSARDVRVDVAGRVRDVLDAHSWRGYLTSTSSARSRW